jgi:hypothetical protein
VDHDDKRIPVPGYRSQGSNELMSGRNQRWCYWRCPGESVPTTSEFASRRWVMTELSRMRAASYELEIGTASRTSACATGPRCDARGTARRIRVARAQPPELAHWCGRAPLTSPGWSISPDASNALVCVAMKRASSRSSLAVYTWRGGRIDQSDNHPGRAMALVERPATRSNLANVTLRSDSPP